jgi:hypothetical protein
MRSFDSLLSLYVQDDKNARLTITKSVSAMITGWEPIREHQWTQGIEKD